jgi:23S rRNA pseudouridine1911/1915/1917 synthase
VHLARIGHPILGDATYGAGFATKTSQLPGAAQEALAALGRQALHAYLLGFEHPLTTESLEFRSELPGDLARLRTSLGAHRTFNEVGQKVPSSQGVGRNPRGGSR